MLNLYSDALATRTLGYCCLAFFVSEIMFDWLLPSLTIFGKGYTPFAFVGLYLLGRYLARKDSIDFRLRTCLPLFFATCVFGGLTMAAASLHGEEMPMLRNKFMFCSSGYTTPLTLAGSFLLVMAFKHMHIRSKAVNWFAASAFAVYLFHGGLPFFKSTALNIFARYDGIAYLWRMMLLIFGTYLAATVIDQVRRFMWAWISNRLMRFSP